MSNLNDFRDELKTKVIDYATTFQLISGSSMKDKKKQDEMNEENYKKLEKFILETYNTWMIDGVRKINVQPVIQKEDTISLDF